MRMVFLVSVYAILISSLIGLMWECLLEFENNMHREKIERDFQKVAYANL